MKWLLLLLLSFGPGLGARAASAVKSPKKREPKVFLIGAELAQYRYSEPGYVEHAGPMFGVWGEWYWNSLLGDGKVYGNVRYGSLEYGGSSCDVNAPFTCRPLTATTNDWIARLNTRLEFKLNPNFQFFAGLGFRYLYDKGELASFYDRIGTWGYVPLGMNFNFASGLGRLFFDLEYDWLVYGKFQSKLSQAQVTPRQPDIEHDQGKGYGIILTAGSDLENGLNVSLFYELWSLEETELVQTYIEPKNSSDTYGLKLGYRF